MRKKQKQTLGILALIVLVILFINLQTLSFVKPNQIIPKTGTFIQQTNEFYEYNLPYEAQYFNTASSCPSVQEIAEAKFEVVWDPNFPDGFNNIFLDKNKNPDDSQLETFFKTNNLFFSGLSVYNDTNFRSLGYGTIPYEIVKQEAECRAFNVDPSLPGPEGGFHCRVTLQTKSDVSSCIGQFSGGSINARIYKIGFSPPIEQAPVQEQEQQEQTPQITEEDSPSVLENIIESIQDLVQPQESQEQAKATESPQDSTQEFPTVYLIGVILLVVILLFIYLKTRRRKRR